MDIIGIKLFGERKHIFSPYVIRYITHHQHFADFFSLPAKTERESEKPEKVEREPHKFPEKMANLKGFRTMSHPQTKSTITTTIFIFDQFFTKFFYRDQLIKTIALITCSGISFSRFDSELLILPKDGSFAPVWTNCWNCSSW